MATVPEAEAARIIEANGLRPYLGLWHYTFDGKAGRPWFRWGADALYQLPVNQFAPPLIYTRSDSAAPRVMNAPIGVYDPADVSPRRVFWHLRLGTFTEFLDRRSQTSAKPHKHFPTRETYLERRDRVAGSVEMEPAELASFARDYDRLRLPGYLRGEEVFENLLSNNPELPSRWLKTVRLMRDGGASAVALIVDDGESVSLENIASERDPLSLGLYLCVEIVRCFSDAGYRSFDAGVSSIYGTYKNKLFLDSYEVYSSIGFVPRVRARASAAFGRLRRPR